MNLNQSKEITGYLQKDDSSYYFSFVATQDDIIARTEQVFWLISTFIFFIML